MSGKVWLLIAILFALAALGWWFYPANGSEKWRYHIGGEVIAPPVLGEDGTLYAASTKVVALTPEGRLKWERNAGGTVRGGLLLSNDGRTLLVESWGSGASVLHALDVVTGNERWQYNVGGGAMEGSVAIGSDGIIYVGGTGFHALSADGKELWSGPFYSNVRPVIGPTGTVYLATLGGRIAALNPEGSERWVFESEDGFTSSPTVDDDGTLYAMNHAGHLFAISPAGQKVWDVRFPSGDFAAPIIGRGRMLYVTGETGKGRGKMYALRAVDGSIVWEEDFDGPVAPPALAADNTIYAGTYAQALHAYWPGGQKRWSFHALAMFGIPVVGNDGTVYVGTNNGWIYAVRASGGALANTAWAKYGRDLKNSGRAFP